MFGQRDCGESRPQIKQGFSYARPSVKTVAEFLSEWLAAIERQVRPTTWSSYKMLVDKHIVPRIGSTPLQKLTALQLNAMYADMLKRGRRDAVGWNLLARNVGGSPQPPKKEKRT